MSGADRHASKRRETRETAISADVAVDGTGAALVALPLPFFRHMIEAFVKYSGMDVTLDGTGDIDVDAHHLVEDVGLVLGAAVSDALGDRDGIRRFGDAHAPLDESLVRCVIDTVAVPILCTRWIRCRAHKRVRRSSHRRIRQGVRTIRWRDHPPRLHPWENPHHIAEAAFKALGLATRDALRVIGGGVPSTKGTL